MACFTSPCPAPPPHAEHVRVPFLVSMHDQIRNNWPQSSTYGCQPFYMGEKNKPVAITHEPAEPVDSDQSDGGFTIRRPRSDDSPFNLPLNVDKGVVFYKGPMPSPLSATKEDLRQPQPDPQGSASSFGVHTIDDAWRRRCRSLQWMAVRSWRGQWRRVQHRHATSFSDSSARSRSRHPSGPNAQPGFRLWPPGAGAGSSVFKEPNQSGFHAR